MHGMRPDPTDPASARITPRKRRSLIGRILARLDERGFSTQFYLIMLVIALIGPGLIFTAILLARYAATERARFEQDARENVRGISLAIDRDIAGLVAGLQTLATSPRLRNGEFESFDAQARLVRDTIGLEIILRKPDGQQVVNTGLQPGSPLPITPLPFDDEIAGGIQRSAVTGYLGASDPLGAAYAIGVAVKLETGVKFILSYAVPLSRLDAMLARDHVHGWSTGLADRDGIVLARIPEMPGVVGRMRLSTLRQYATDTPGVWEGKDRAFKPVTVVEERSRFSGWTVAASIPQHLVEARLRRWIWAFGGFGLLVLATSSALAVHLWSRVSRPLRQLAATGPALSRGQAIPRISSPIHEIRRLGDVLADASLRLRTRSEERDRALADTQRGLAALRESEARFRVVADSAPALIWMTDENSEIVFANMHFDELFGRPYSELAGEGWHKVIHPPDLPAFAALFEEAVQQRTSFKAEMRVIDRNGAVRWLRCEGVPRLDETGVFLGYTGCNIDITDAKRAEEHLILLINELNHRVKNTLATVQSIALQSLRGLEGEEAEAARSAFENRLLALARVHDVLTRENWEGAEMGAVVADAIRPLDGGGQTSRFSVSGPPLRLPPRLALSIAMALHELGTNAVKYGALSNEDGRIEITWTVARGAETRLGLHWSESGGPPVKRPTRTGFGSRLIERSLARELEGKVELLYEPGGVVCTIDAPVPPPGLLERKGGTALPRPVQPLALPGTGVS